MRAENAPLVLATLSSAFKTRHVPSVPESRLRAHLDALIEDLSVADVHATAKSAREYLSDWAGPQHGYLRRYQPPGDDEPLYELTPEAELVFRWIETLKPRPHVGTESAFKNLADVLDDIVVNSNQEPDLRIRRLEEERASLQRQIDEIRRTGVATVYSPTQVNERFATLLETSRRLLGDFREVERHFRRVTEEIAVRQTDAAATRGAIVGRTLDAQEELRWSSQGQSFYAFWEFLLDPPRRRAFLEMVEQAYQIPSLSGELRSDPVLRGLEAALRAEGGKVVASNERLVAQLRRVLDIRESAERRQVGRLIQEIKSAAYRTRHLAPTLELLEVEELPLVTSLMSRSQWSPPQMVPFGGSLELSDGGDHEAALEAFRRMHPIDFARLRENVRESLKLRVQVPLPEILRAFPPRNGAVEILGYLLIAETDGPHVVFDELETVFLPGPPPMAYRIPQVIFSNT